jgi:hypothetical protein
MKLCSKVERRRWWRRRERRRNSHLGNPLVLIMTPFLIITLYIY